MADYKKTETSDYIKTIEALGYMQKIYNNQFIACLNTLKDDIENFKKNTIEDIVTRIANDFNIDDKDKLKKYININSKKKNKNKKNKDIDEVIVQNIVNNDNLENYIKNFDKNNNNKEEIIEEKKDNVDIKEKKQLYIKLNTNKLPEYFNNNEYYVKIETNEIIERETKEIVGKYDNNKISFYKSHIEKLTQNNN